MDGVKGKAAAPFYVAPQRLTLQTPCEIIREARAGVMGARDGRGLRAVPTSRPFTPKERERVLFGAARRGARPPSAVNLSYLHRSDSGGEGGVKLPSIASASQRASTSRHLTRTVFSLDNLVEEAEVPGGLPGLRKSYSSPQERAPSRLASTPDQPRAHVLRDRWTSESSLLAELQRQNSEPMQRKKVHRLQSLPSAGSSENCGPDLIPHLPSQDQDTRHEEDYGPIGDGTLIGAEEDLPMAESVEERKENLGQHLISNSEKIMPDDAPLEDAMAPFAADTVLPTAADMSSESVASEPPDEADMVAVLSDGKLVWEAPRPMKQPYQPPQIDPPAKTRPSAEPRMHLQSMRHNLNNVQGRMQQLHTQIEQLGDRVASGSTANAKNGSFFMNNNKRYHVSAKTATGSATGVKAYRKWSEGAQTEEEEETPSPPPARQDSAGWDFFWKNSYFRAKEETLSPELQPLAELLEELRAMHGQGGEEALASAEGRLNTLYVTLLANDAFAQGGMPNSFKSKLLQTLYMFAEVDRPRLLLLIARLVLALRVESGLPAACKMVFKVARSDDNDHLFTDVPDILELFLDGIGRASPLDSAESCIYGYGALKFLTVNPTLLAQALHLGALDLVTLHLKMVNSAQEDGAKVGEQTQHALFQLTGALRNIADGDGIGPLFLTTNCLPTLANTLVLFRADDELVSNIARTLSSLSSDEDLAKVLLSVDDLPVTLVDLLRQYQSKDQILIRLGYTLGNVLACSDLARVQLSRHESCLPTLLYVLQLYIEKETTSTEELEATDDVIVKVVRVVANMSMNPVVGSHLSALAGQDSQLAALLRRLVDRHGAVLLAALGCLNNLSYYVQAPSCLRELTQGVLAVLASSPPSQECAVEACKVLGNLTRHKLTRDLLKTEGGLETLEHVLTSAASGAVARSVCGVLVNMLLDKDSRHSFLQHRGIDKLVLALERYTGDWLLAGLVCRAIWNACAPDIALAVEHNDMDHLLTTLANCLEEENWADGDAEWEEFAGIATDLLERFNAHLECTN